ncbi:MAG: 6-phosphogluconolactonase [Candidatus Aenigmarchaeota archaeon]|nr:6-phosphogluconolactonase [Candidatus Aenigmarchaeota archaeon]
MKNFKIKVFDDLEELGNYTANQVMGQYRQKGKLVLGIPWGSTPIPFFQSFGKLVRKGEIGLENVDIFVMDEYIMPSNGGYSFGNENVPYGGHYKIKTDFLGELPPKVAERVNIHFPDPNNPGNFEKLIKSLGGIDIFLVATGAEDGHVAMCGPGTPLESNTRIIEISESVRDYNFTKYKEYFGNDKKNVPKYGITVGLRTILDARRLLFVAHGSEKARIVETLYDAKGFDANWPITFLWEAKEKTELYIDKTVARNIAGLVQGE